MRLFFGKLGFIHRRLWERGGHYRLALCFGPAPLIGVGLAAAVWWGVATVQTKTQPLPDWAHYTARGEENGSEEAPNPVKPARPLPPLRADGSAIGYDRGWAVTINPLSVDAALEARVDPVPISGFTIDDTTATMARIRDSGPKDRLFIGVSSGYLVVRDAGTHSLFLHFERQPGPAATCLTRLTVNGRFVSSNVMLDMVQHVSRNFPPAWLALQPGLYNVRWAFGCWHGNDVSDSGQITLMQGDADGHAAQPVQAEDIVH